MSRWTQDRNVSAQAGATCATVTCATVTCATVTCASAMAGFRVASAAIKIAGVSLLALTLANCAKQTSTRTSHNSREIGAFSDPKYGKASPRVVGLDDDAPKGGGRYQVGRPYQVAGRTYVPRERPVGYTVSGNASWYGIAFHGRKTANGEVYDRNSISAAHPTMPLPSYARVTNLNNNHSIVVRVNDRGPYHGGRVLDVSERTANMLKFRHLGTARVKVDYLGPAALAGSDDTRLVASLNTNGPASAPIGGNAPTMVASIEPVATARPQMTALSYASQTGTSPRAVPVSRPAPENAGVITETKFVPVSNLPVPPARPFDLDTIGGAATPVTPGGVSTGQRISRGEILPPARPTDLSFVEMGGGFSRFGKGHPFSRMGELELRSDVPQNGR
ncbi:MAG: rare lipoprotein [Beijerinckiaceae bacterium]|nr:MAG: rare lipoprotein [Beijerinckiaceae bacterium]